MTDAVSVGHAVRHFCPSNISSLHTCLQPSQLIQFLSVLFNPALDDFAHAGTRGPPVAALLEHPADLFQSKTKRLSLADETHPRDVKELIRTVAVARVTGGTEQPNPRIVPDDVRLDAALSGNLEYSHSCNCINARWRVRNNLRGFSLPAAATLVAASP